MLRSRVIRPLPKRPAAVAPMILIGITIVTAGTFAEFALGQLGAAFNTDLGLPIADIGVLASVMFISGGVASIPAGWVIDRAPLVVMTLLQGVLAMVAFASFALVSGPVGLTIACAASGCSWRSVCHLRTEWSRCTCRVAPTRWSSGGSRSAHRLPPCSPG